MKKIEVVTASPRRRRFSEEQKTSILREAEEPGVTLAEVARRHEIAASLIHHWRRRAAEMSNFIKILPQDSPNSVPLDKAIRAGVRIASPTGYVLDLASPLSLREIAALARMLGERA